FISADYTGRTARWRRIAAVRARSAVEVAHVVRFGAREERLADHFRAVRPGQFAGFAIDVHEGDAGRRLEWNAGVAGERRPHALGPDPQGRARGAQADRLVVIESDPDHREQLRREANEPGVAQV